MNLPSVQEKVHDLCDAGIASLETVLNKLNIICQKPINLIEVNESWGALTAFKAEFEDRINIYVSPQNTIQYKRHCIYHELGHIYLESLHIPFVKPHFSEKILKETAGAINVSCRSVPNHPVELWAEKFAFELSAKTRTPRSHNPDPFLC